jgi:hypothetical protein
MAEEGGFSPRISLTFDAGHFLAGQGGWSGPTRVVHPLTARRAAKARAETNDHAGSNYSAAECSDVCANYPCILGARLAPHPQAALSDRARLAWCRLERGQAQAANKNIEPERPSAGTKRSKETLVGPTALSALRAFEHVDDNSAFRFHDRSEESELSSAQAAVMV